MSYYIHVTDAAERDIQEAYDYIDLTLKNPTAASGSRPGRWPSWRTSWGHPPGSTGAEAAAPFRSFVCLHGA